MKRTIIVISFILCTAFLSGINTQAADPLVGLWYNIADSGKHKGKASSHIEIFEKNGVYYAKVNKLLNDPQDTKCDKCKGSKKDKPIVGMLIVWGMKKDGDEYKGGRIMDPENGKDYGCKMKLMNNKKLRVRGYLAFFYRTQYWYRLK